MAGVVPDNGQGHIGRVDGAGGTRTDGRPRGSRSGRDTTLRPSGDLIWIRADNRGTGRPASSVSSNHSVDSHLVTGSPARFAGTRVPARPRRPDYPRTHQSIEARRRWLGLPPGPLRAQPEPGGSHRMDGSSASPRAAIRTRRATSDRPGWHGPGAHPGGHRRTRISGRGDRIRRNVLPPVAPLLVERGLEAELLELLVDLPEARRGEHRVVELGRLPCRAGSG